MRALLLPGMDGTGKLLVEFASRLSPEFDADIVVFPPAGPSSYDALSDFAESRLPRNEPFLLIAESFSGPIGIRLAATHPPGLNGLVLCATFAASPHPWSRLLSPLLKLPAPKPPIDLLMPFAMGRWRTPQWTSRLHAAIGDLPSSLARARLAEALHVDATRELGDVACSILYLQASHDRLVPASCWRAIHRRSPHARCVRLEGPHFLLQHQPDLAAATIKRYFGAI